MNFDTSAQKARWMQQRENSDNSKAELIVRSCAYKVYQISKVNNYPKYVIFTAMAYVRRFFRIESVDDHDISLFIVTVLYLAGKVEEVPPIENLEMNQRGLDMDKLCKCVENKTRTAEMWKVEAIRNEMKLLVGLNFDLLCFHPLRPAQGFLERMKKAGASVPAGYETILDEAIWVKCVGSYLVGNLIFEHPPGFLGAVCLYSAIQTVNFKDDASKQVLFESLMNEVESVNGALGPADGFRTRLLAVVETLENGLKPELEKEANKAYSEHIRKGK